MANGTLAASQLEMLSQSGTGIITITPPATNTNRAITLPDAAGTIQVSGNPSSGTTGTFTGLVDISAAGAGQIAFPATQNASANANTLDDYEEGTWTPSVGGTATYTNQFGRYTKIGNKVFIEGLIEINVLGTGSTGNILGLPFSSIATNPLGTASVGFFSGAAGAVAYLSATIATSSTQVSLRNVAPGGGTAMSATTFFANGAALFFTANYTA